VGCRRREASDQRASGLLYALRRLLLSAGELLSTRVELLALEARQEAVRILGSLMLLLLTAVFLAFTLAGASVLLVAVFWDSHRMLALTMLTVVFAASPHAAEALRRDARRIAPGRRSHRWRA
jgi:uncharacterized membrane protein YqjE